MKGLLVATVLVVMAAGALGGAVRQQGSPRQARWFLSRGDVTEVVEEERRVTQVTPWSCVVVAPSLPPCRHVRQLNIEATPPTPISATVGPALHGFYGDHNLVEQARRRYYLDAIAPQDSFYGDMIPVPNYPAAPAPSAHNGWVPMMGREATDPLPAAPAAPTTAPAAPAAPATAAAPPTTDQKREQGWAEWLGLRAHTVTTTLVRYATTKVVDPDTVVTFSVRGCQPSKLPFDLPLCEQPTPQPAPQPAEPQTHSLTDAPAVEVSAAAPAAPEAPAPAPAPAAAPAPAPVETIKADGDPAPADVPAPAVAPAEPAPATGAAPAAAPAPAPAPAP